MSVGQEGSNDEIVRVEYKNDIPLFINGDIEFYFDDDGGNLSFQLYDGNNWETIKSYSGKSGPRSIDLEQQGYSNVSDFGLRFEFEGRNKDATVDNLTLGNYEFSWTMLNDTIHPNEDQVIDLYLNPNFTNYIDDLDIDNVSLWYNVNDEQVQNGNRIISDQTANNFTFTLPASNYSSGDKVYYQIWINHDTTQEIHRSSIANFSCVLINPPNITDVTRNQTAKYYEDVAIECHIEPHEDEESLDDVEMYISYEADPNSSNTIIESNHSSIPSEGGDFKFVIPSHNLSARVPNNRLYYRINATDIAGNSAYYTGNFTIEDDVEPNIKLDNIYAPDHGIENNESLTVSYNISEPSDGSGMGLYSPYIFAKINEEPENASDYEIIAQADNSPGYDGGIYNFTILEGNYSYGDWVYFFVNGTDNHGNTNSSFENYQKIFVNDTLAPRVMNHTENGIAANYNQNKTLTFTVTEPEGASGINNDSLVLEYWVNQTGDHQIINKSLSLFGGDINFTIDQKEYLYNDTVFYRLNVSDIANNTYTSKVGFFNVSDWNAPNADYLSLSNESLIDYKTDFNITFSVFEDPAGSLFKSVKLFVKNGSSGSWEDARRVYKTNASEALNKGGGLQTFFEINSSLTNARKLLYWNITVIDNEENQNSSVGSVKIFDFEPPEITFLDHNGRGTGTDQIEFEYYQNIQVNYSVWEPHDASGLHNDSTKFKLFYKINGDEAIYNVTAEENVIASYSDILNFIIPESELSYGNLIEVWLNGSDLQGNINSTRLYNQTFTIIDLTSPTISLDGDYNNEPISYHLNKKVKYTSFEPIDASGLKNATIYWKKGSAPTYGDFNDTIVNTGIDQYPTDEISWDLSRLLFEFQYGDEIFFFINIYDVAGNNRTSEINSFNITDEVNPTSIEDSENSREWTWRADRELNFSVFDLDYPNSSGVESIILYYKGGSAPTTSDYHNKTIVPVSDITRNNNSYSIKVYLNETIYNAGNNHSVYYLLQILDVAGNEATLEGLFEIHNDVFKFSSIVGPEQGEWLTTEEVQFSFDLYFETNAQILVNGTAIKTHLYNYSGCSIDSLTETLNFKEGTHEVRFEFLDGNSVKEFLFSIDLYPPSPVKDLSKKIFGFEIVKISWEEPEGVDSDSVYKLYRSEDKEFRISDEYLLTEIKAGEQLKYEDNDIEPGKTYYYKIVIIDRVGHISEPSNVVEAKVPENNFSTIITVIVIGAAVSVVGAFVYRSVRTKKRERILSQVDLSEIDDKFDYDEMETDEPKWTQIQTKAKAKPELKPAPVTQEGFEFSEQEAPKASTSVQAPQIYWKTQLGELLSKATSHELQGDLATAQKIYRMIQRISQQTGKRRLAQKIEAKLGRLYTNLKQEA
ncbi:MAG: hypothetical protein ACOC35_04295 [Promethearchaeia archaeon]